MSDQNRPLKWGIVLFTMVFGVLLCWPPKERLKLGIDLAGGTSLLYEIDTTGLNDFEVAGLSTRVMEILKERVDPNQTMNLVWRPVGNTRLEIQMPLPSPEAQNRRQVKEAAFKALRERNVRRFEIETALSVPPDQVDSALSTLTRGVGARTPLWPELRAAADARKAAPDDYALREAYEAVLERVLATNLDEVRLRDMLELTLGRKEAREAELAKVIQQHPGYEDLIKAAASVYDAWASRKSALEDPSDLKRRLKGAGVLEFRILADRDAQNPTFIASQDPNLRERIDEYTESLQKRGPRLRTGDHYRWIPIKDLADFMGLDRRGATEAEFEERRNQYGQIIERYAGQWYVLAHEDPEYTMIRAPGRDWKLEEAFPNLDSRTGQHIVSFRLNPVGGDFFSELTGNNVNRDLCVVLDGQAMSFANINERIGQTGQIQGRFTSEKVNELCRVLQAGALPGRLKETPLSEKTVGPSLGAHNLAMAEKASLYGFLVLLVVVVVYYGFTAGLIADLALTLNLVLLLASMAFLQATFTLPGIAGVALTLGMAIDANVLVFERIREERDRGVPIKKAIALGYQKAFSSIIDGNLTTMITCIVLGWMGSEEVKGFAITLGIGLVVSLYTALFVTRLFFNTLVGHGWVKDLRMQRLLSKPSVDWMSRRKGFFAFSVVASTLGLGSFLYLSVQNRDALYDIEFLGGSSVEVEFLDRVPVTDEDVRKWVSSSEPGVASVANWLAQAADDLEETTVRAGETPRTFIVESTSDRLNGEQIRALLHAQVSDACDDIRVTGQAVVLTLKSDVPLTLEDVTQRRNAAADIIRDRAAPNLRGARVQLSQEVSTSGGEAVTRYYEIVSVETDLQFVQTAILAVLGDKLKIEEVVSYRTVSDSTLTNAPYFVVEEEDRYLSDVIGGDYVGDVSRFKGGVAVQVEQLDPPLTIDEFKQRLDRVQLQAEYQATAGRERDVRPLGASVGLRNGAPAYDRFVVLTADDALPYSDEDAALWRDAVATPELKLVESALGASRTLRKVIQFAPQVAEAARQDAVAAIIVALGAILAYIWIRFGGLDYGLAAIVATFHDVAFVLGAIAFSHVIGATSIGQALGIFPFKVDLAMIAALLTIIGYSLNDTVVVFDRIRENRGKGTLNAGLLNTGINETLSRTVLTGGTTLVMLIFLYTMGGQGIRGFNYAFLIGILIGTYSSIAVASPLLFRPDKLFIVSKLIAGTLAAALVLANVDHRATQLVLLSVLAAGVAYWIFRGRSEPVRTAPA